MNKKNKALFYQTQGWHGRIHSNTSKAGKKEKRTQVTTMVLIVSSQKKRKKKRKKKSPIKCAAFNAFM